MNFTSIKKGFLFVIIIGAMLFSLNGCASIMSGSQQNVVFKSNEPDADIIVDGVKMGKTPKVIKLKRGVSHHIEIKKEGYETYRITTGQTITGWFWGNILCGGLLGIIIDLATGNAFDIDPDVIDAHLDKGTAMLGASDSYNKSGIYIVDRSGQISDTFVIEWE